jgi:hypothetical protein
VVPSDIKSVSYLTSKKKICRHEQFDEKPQETLDEHVARSFEGIAGNDCVRLLRFAVSDPTWSFSIRSGDRRAMS